ncbi:MAG: O-antigen/teichoic acid export membrane protein [Flavobacterium sp.]|jgi:O-antigen/teichoic acid export membrane protein
MNLIANYTGQLLVTLIGIMVLPVYIGYLGAESFGLVGFFGVLTVWFGILDMGLTPAVSRQMSSFTGGGITLFEARSVLRSLEFLFFCVAFCIVVIVYAASEWLATNWLTGESLSAVVIQKTIVLMGFLVGFHFVANIYRSALIGLQKHVLYNLIIIFIACAKALGAVAVLRWYEPTVIAFFSWQIGMEIVSIGLLAASTYFSLRGKVKPVPNNFKALIKVKDFAGGMFLITLLTLCLTQIDKVLLTKLTSLEEFGWYALAAIVSGAIYMAVTPITQTFYPRFVSYFVKSDHESLQQSLISSSVILSSIVGSLSVFIIVYAPDFLLIWTDDEILTSKITTLVIFLTAANLLNALMYMPYQLLLSHGITRVTVIANSVSLFLLAPTFLLIVPIYGAMGAASIWLCFNAVYLVVMPRIIFKIVDYKIAPTWYIVGCVLPLSIASLVALLSRQAFRLDWSSINQILYMGVCGILAIALSSLSSKDVRQKLCEMSFFLNIKNIQQ